MARRRQKTALLVIDMQVGMFDSPKLSPVHRSQALLDTVSRLIDAARRKRVPVIFVQHCGSKGHPLEEGTPGWRIHRAIAPERREAVIFKRQPDAFDRTRLNTTLKTKAIKKLIVSGIQSDFCIDSTCRRAFSLGYEVILAADAHSTWALGRLTAAEIIAHHNAVLGSGFATVKPAERILADELAYH
jgi:nicotinamidase-related amidase